jgi:sigma-54 dependent transcriptional regulator, acetoin dehydrogenase operon transcriptional activator AcoR
MHSELDPEADHDLSSALAGSVSCAVSALRVLSSDERPLLIRGERGVGKKQLARMLHDQSARSAAPFTTVECAGKSAEALTRELFGFVEEVPPPGSPRFTPGKIHGVAGGTLFIEDVDQLSPAAGRSLLRALDSAEPSHGDHGDARSGDFRLICSSTHDLSEAVAHGRFAPELYRRIARTQVVVPPLRTRGGELALLADHFAKEAARETGSEQPSFPDDVLQAFARYDWPGNLHELREVIRGAMRTNSGVVERDALPSRLLAASQVSDTNGTSVLEGLELAEFRAIRECLRSNRGNLTRTARDLRIARSTLYAKLKKYGLADGLEDLRLAETRAVAVIEA